MSAEGYNSVNFDEFLIARGISQKSITRLKRGESYYSAINKINIIKLADNFPANDKGFANLDKIQPKTVYDLIKASTSMGAVQYEIEDFEYCKWLGAPINRLITLRRFPFPCTDNIYDKFNQAEPDIARMVTYRTNDNNKLEDLLSFGYHLKWKELESAMEQASMTGDQTGFTAMSKKLMKWMDPVMAQNRLRGDNALSYDPTHDQNKVYGPVDSLTSTHIRDVGLAYDQKFDLVFEYEAKSIDGKSPEFAMRDIIANVLATTYNDAKFWPGARYWVGERPSSFLKNFKKYRDVKSVDSLFAKAYADIKSGLKGDVKGKAIDALKRALKNGLTMAVGRMLDKVGRPSIPVMNSLLSGEPVGLWHVMIGNPYNPIMSVGNLIIDDVQFKFPTEDLSYGDFPTKLQVTITLKPAMPKDKAGAEMMFNMGKMRLYHQPKKIHKSTSNNVKRKARPFEGQGDSEIVKAVAQVINFSPGIVEDTVKVVTDSYKSAKIGAKTAEYASTAKQTISETTTKTKQAALDLYKNNSIF